LELLVKGQKRLSSKGVQNIPLKLKSQHKNKPTLADTEEKTYIPNGMLLEIV